MKKKLSLLLVVLICAMFCAPVALAANQVPEMEIEVALRPDGSAYITQVWSADTDEGTEFYLGCHDSGCNFCVSGMCHMSQAAGFLSSLEHSRLKGVKAVPSDIRLC